MSFLADSFLGSDLNHFIHIPGFPTARSHRDTAGSRVVEEGSFGVVPVDILETPKSYTFFLDVPGVSKSDIQVTLEDEKILAIKSSGKRKRDDVEEEGCRYLRLERKKAVQKFVKNFRLPEDADASAITAKCEDGVLTVVVEKLPPPPEPKPKKVVVAVA